MSTQTVHSSNKMSTDQIDDQASSGNTNSAHREMQERLRKLEEEVATLRQENDTLRTKAELQWAKAKDLMDKLDVMGKDMGSSFGSTERKEMVEKIEALEFSNTTHQKVQDRMRDLLQTRLARIKELESSNARLSNESKAPKKKKGQLKQQIKEEDEEKDREIQGLQSEVSALEKLIKALELEKTRDIGDLNMKITKSVEDAHAKEEKMAEEVRSLKEEIRLLEECCKTSKAAKTDEPGQSEECLKSNGVANSGHIGGMATEAAAEAENVEMLRPTKVPVTIKLKAKNKKSQPIPQAEERRDETELSTQEKMDMLAESIRAREREVAQKLRELKDSNDPNEHTKSYEPPKGIEVKGLKKQVKWLDTISEFQPGNIQNSTGEGQQPVGSQPIVMTTTAEVEGLAIEKQSIATRKILRPRHRLPTKVQEELEELRAENMNLQAFRDWCEDKHLGRIDDLEEDANIREGYITEKEEEIAALNIEIQNLKSKVDSQAVDTDASAAENQSPTHTDTDNSEGAAHEPRFRGGLEHQEVTPSKAVHFHVCLPSTSAKADDKSQYIKKYAVLDTETVSNKSSHEERLEHEDIQGEDLDVCLQFAVAEAEAAVKTEDNTTLADCHIYLAAGKQNLAEDEKLGDILGGDDHEFRIPSAGEVEYKSKLDITVFSVASTETTAYEQSLSGNEELEDGTEIQIKDFGCDILLADMARYILEDYQEYVEELDMLSQDTLWESFPFGKGLAQGPEEVCFRAAEDINTAHGDTRGMWGNLLSLLGC